MQIDLDLSEIERYVEKLGRNSDLIHNELERAMTESVVLVEGEVVQRTPVNFGTLRQSVGTRVSGRGLEIQGEISTPSPYGLPVEFGRKPGSFPPIRPIELWVRRKLQVSNEEAESVAFLVARKIATKGTTGAFMFTEAFEASENEVGKRFDQATQRITRKMANL